MSLSLVNTFASAYEAWETRNPTSEEASAAGGLFPVKVKLIAYISSASDAAKYIATVGSDNGLERFIDNALDNSVAYKSWGQS